MEDHPVLTTTEEKQINDNELVCRSYLQKRSTLSWKKLWFVLRKNNQLTIYKDDNEHKPIDIINLTDDLTVSKIIKKDKYQFALFSPTNKTIHLKAFNEFDYNTWFLNLEKILRNHNDLSIDDKGSLDDTTFTRPSTASIPNTASTNYNTINANNSEEEMLNDDEDYFTSDNEAGPTDHHQQINTIPIIEEEEEILKIEQNLIEEQSSTNKLNLEKIKKISPDFMKDYLIQHYSYNSSQNEHLIQKGYLLRLKNLNQWKKFFIVLTNKNLIFYKIHNYSDTKNIDYQLFIDQLNNINKDKKLSVLPAKVLDLKNLVDVVELDPLSKSKQNCLLIITPIKRYRFCTMTEMELVNWLIIFKSILIVRQKEQELNDSNK